MNRSFIVNGELEWECFRCVTCRYSQAGSPICCMAQLSLSSLASKTVFSNIMSTKNLWYIKLLLRNTVVLLLRFHRIGTDLTLCLSVFYSCRVIVMNP